MDAPAEPQNGLPILGQPSSRSGLQSLPYEIIAYVVHHLDVDEIFDLSLCSRQFQYLIREERFCRTVLCTKAPFALETTAAEETGGYARAFRRLVKRRRAFAQASPYVAGIVALADTYLYSEGSLCYIHEQRPRRWLRILDLQGQSSEETVVDIPNLIAEAVPRAAECTKYKFRVLRHSHGITTCLFSFSLLEMTNTEHWLLIFKPSEGRMLNQYLLESTNKIFVRNNEDYLYFGTHSEIGPDGFRKWALCGYDVAQNQWFPNRVHLSNLVGNDIGSTICFEIFDGFLYGLSNQHTFRGHEVLDWSSFYYCFRFPLQSPEREKTQVMRSDDSWRRQHAEGPIDDRWSFLTLQRDETSGEVYIVESRKEFLSGQSRNRRSYYSTKTVFCSEPLATSVGSTGPSHARGDVRSEDETKQQTNTNEMRPLFRSPHDFHVGDDSAEALFMTRSKTHLRSYQRSCNAYLDLVDDPTPARPNERRLRLRTGYRKLKAASELATVQQERLTTDDLTRILYQPNQIYKWPPQPTTRASADLLENVYQILNPPQHFGDIHATSDERCVVYMIGQDSNGLKAIVYLSFDPAAKLAGMKRGGSILGELERYGGAVTGQPEPDFSLERGKGKRRSDEYSGVGSLPRYPESHLQIRSAGAPDLYNRGWGSKTWAWSEGAMYLDLPQSFTFAR